MGFNLSLLFPEILAAAFFLLLLVRELLMPASDKKSTLVPGGLIAFIGALSLFLSLITLSGRTGTAMGGVFILDPLALFFKTFFSFTVMFILLMSQEFFRAHAGKSGEFFLILFSSLIGLFFLVSSNDFLLLFISLEILTLSGYIMAAYSKQDLFSIESGLKYLILGSLASAFLIYGVSLLYVATGSTHLPEIRIAVMSPDQASPSLILLGILFVLSGLCFKVASVPFQLWVPDVYEGAPTPVVAYLAVGSKAAGFAILMRLLFTVFLPLEPFRALLFATLAAMTLLYGNLGALVQTNIKRLFGYSSIAHAGYLLMGVAAGKEAGRAALLYYLIAYAVSNLAAFFVITLCEKEIQSNHITAYRGLAKRSPFLAGTLFIALLSLAGVPPLAGFFGKFLILLAAVKAHLGWLALLGALAVAVSLYYSLTIVRMMYFEESSSETPIHIPFAVRTALMLLVAGILIVGFWQTPFLGFALQAAQSLF